MGTTFVLVPIKDYEINVTLYEQALQVESAYRFGTGLRSDNHNLQLYINNWIELDDKFEAVTKGLFSPVDIINEYERRHWSELANLNISEKTYESAKKLIELKKSLILAPEDEKLSNAISNQLEVFHKTKPVSSTPEYIIRVYEKVQSKEANTIFVNDAIEIVSRTINSLIPAGSSEDDAKALRLLLKTKEAILSELKNR